MLAHPSGPNPTLTKAVRKLDCRTHKWHPVPSMRVARASAAVGVVGGKIYVLGGCGDPDSWAEVFDPNTQSWDSLPLPDQTIRCQYIHDSVVVIKDREEKIYAVNGLDHTFNYSPSESIWGRGTICPHARNRRDWCVVGQLIFSIDGRGNLCWCEPGQLDSEQGEMCWRDVKGLVSLKESLSSSRLVHFDRKFEAMWESYKMKMNRGNRRLNDLLPGARLSYSGPNIVLFWDVVEGDRLDIWCAEISLERQGQDMWGNIDWCDVVMTADHVLDRFKILHSVSVSL